MRTRIRSIAATSMAFLFAAFIAGGALLVNAPLAAASTVKTSTNCGSYADLTNWSESLSVKQFNPSAGNLQSISVQRTVTGTTEAGSENHKNANASVTFSTVNDVALASPGVAGSLTLHQEASRNVNLGPWDGVLDYAGTSGAKYGVSLETHTDTTVLTDWSGWVGSGSVAGLDASASATNGNTIDNGNGDMFVRTNDTAQLCVTYTYQVGSIGDCVINDANHDGIQQPGENGVPGVTVTLLDANTGAIVRTVTTDAAGCYHFGDLSCVTWKVLFSNIPAGWTLSPVNVGGDTSVDSNGLVSTVSLAGCPDDTTVDLLIYNTITPHPPTAVADAAAGPRASMRLRKVILGKTTKFVAGAKVPFKVTVSNTSAIAATSVHVCDKLPSGMTFVRSAHATFENGQACWTLKSLAAHASKSFIVTIRLAGTLKAHACPVNTATATSTNASSVRATRKACVKRAAVAAAKAPPVTGRIRA